MSWEIEATKTVRTLQIIIGAIAMGAILFVLIASTIAPLSKPPVALLPIPLYLIVIILVCVGLIVRFIYMWHLTTKARREVINGTYQSIDYRQRMRLPLPIANQSSDSSRDAQYLLSAFRYKSICSTAMIAGWCFLATTIYLIDGNPIILCLAVLLVMGVAANFPTRSRAIRCIENELTKVKQEKDA